MWLSRVYLLARSCSMRFGTFHEAEEAMMMLKLEPLVMIVGLLVAVDRLLQAVGGQLVGYLVL